MPFLDLSDVQVQSKDFSPIPDGTYIAKVTKAEVKDTQKVGGKKIDIGLQVTAGKHANRIVFDSFNIKNESEKAQRIGLENLKTMMNCAGMGDVLETVSDLEGKIVAIKVGSEKKHNSEEMKNVVKAYLSMNAPGVAAEDKPKAEVPWV